MWTCSKCGKNSQDHLTECLWCKAPRGPEAGPARASAPATGDSQKFCGKCGAALFAGMKFCGGCGVGVTPPVSGAAVRTSQSHGTSPGRQTKCYYCQKLMNYSAIRCPSCGKYLREIENDKNKARAFSSTGMVWTIIGLIWALNRRWELRLNEQLRTYWILYMAVGVILLIFALPPLYRAGKRTGEGFWFSN